MNLISVIVPCYNEEGNLKELHSRLIKVLSAIDISHQIVYVNDCSTDSSINVLKELELSSAKVVVVNNDKNIGMGRSWVAGLNASDGEYVVLIDADLQYQPEDIKRLFRELIYKNKDLIQGYRSSIGRLKDSRFILSKGLNFLLNFLFGMNAKDNKSGFIITRRTVLDDIFTTRFDYKHPQTFILISAVSKGYSYSEIEVIFSERLVGNSFIKLIPIILVANVLHDLIKAFYEFKISRKNVTVLSKYIKKSSSKKGAPDRSIFKKALLWIYFHSMPLHAWVLTRNVKTYYNELSRSQWLSRQEIHSLQLEKLKNMVNHCYYHVEYYREKFDQVGLKPENIKTLDDIRKIPFLTKNQITENLYFGIISDNHIKKDMLKIVTSGSTGTPFTCFADRYQLEMRWAATLRSMEWTGYVFGDRCARLWHQTIGMSLSQIIKEYIDSFLSRRIFIPAYTISSNKIDAYMNKLCKQKPVLIDGYAESFNFLAQYLATGKRIDLSPKAILSSAQILPEPSRRIISKIFGAKVYDKYGSREFSGIAYESGEEDVHLVVAENYIVEIIKNNLPAQPGELGEIVVTDLNNKCLPFLRYKIGDLAIALDPKRMSKCGRGLPLIGRIEGRIQAIIIGANNNFLPGTFFAHFFKEYMHCILQYQIIQNVLGEVDLKIIKGSRFTVEQFNSIIEKLRVHLGDSMKINVDFVNDIEMIRTGKHQGAISNIKIDFQKINEILKG
jgi:phenylacetate-CoA ligase